MSRTYIIMCKVMFVSLFLFGAVQGDRSQKSPRICVIGAGVSGLSVTYYLQKAGMKYIDVFETSNDVGGTWRYDERVGRDDDNFTIHSSMYKSLRTNLPRQTMEFPDFSMQPETPTFPSGKCFLNYIQKFAKQFNLYKYIKFSHRVTSVTKEGDRWNVEYVRKTKKFIEEYDYVLVCNGHNHEPNWPDNMKEVRRNFSGIIMHSHDYREPTAFANKNVLVVGAGPSAWDIGLEVATVARKLVHSHHFKADLRTPFPAHYVRKPDIKSVNDVTIMFDDDTSDDVDVIIYCTGYQYYYPFLDDTSLELALEYVAPLYQNMVNIHQPTMVFLGLGVHGLVTTAIHVQARYTAALIAKQFTLPSTSIMMEEWQKELLNIEDNRKPLKFLHDLGRYEMLYYRTWTTEAGIEPISPTLVQMGKATTARKLEDWYTFRLYNYKVINNTHFTEHYDPHQKPCGLNTS